MGLAREAAGCVVFQETPEGVHALFIWLKERSDPRLPKGGVEPGETFKECALREVLEETGYQVSLLHADPIIVEAYKVRYLSLTRMRLMIQFYAAAIVGGSPEERSDRELVTKVGWLPIEKALSQMKLTEEKEALIRCHKLYLSLPKGDEQGS